ncbi:hypothetical protein STPYR_11794 [uncultured Stenotrophomonas sp.]|uniref:Uncharacterized protein n=1 Tax=uncultured Stenotrophomonas sp. TaxID=165438 RepID=A0A1Y5Q9Y1_9GAMM|nr:hypothetical protein STPYR_11794 [uncultured Stenotrophomonas sp.]
MPWIRHEETNAIASDRVDFSNGVVDLQNRGQSAFSLWPLLFVTTGLGFS